MIVRQRVRQRQLRHMLGLALESGQPSLVAPALGGLRCVQPVRLGRLEPAQHTS